MHVEYAQLPPPENSADRIFITSNAVIVLDGASAFIPVSVSAQTYADHLGRRLAEILTVDPDHDLRDGLAEAVRRTAEALDLVPGESPSSTICVLRERSEEYDALVLGNSALLWGAGDQLWRLTDSRLSHIAVSQRDEYWARLRAGYGFDDHHRESLRALQATQRKFRNIEDGYWIAEADPTAAYNALIITIPRSQLEWSVIATDGAFDVLMQQSCEDWSFLATASGDRLADLLTQLHQWEATSDPSGRQRPRAKRHDDKTLAVITPTR